MTAEPRVSTRPTTIAPLAAVSPTALAGRRLLLVGTGAISVSLLPYWVNWLRAGGEAVDVRIVLTRSAERFVSPVALSALLGRPVEQDSWESASAAAPHVELAAWAELVIVHPCSFSFLARFSQGLADTPTLLALHCVTVPTVICPAPPPGAARGVAYRRHLEALAELGHITVLPPTAAISATTGERNAAAPALFPSAVGAVLAAEAALRARV